MIGAISGVDQKSGATYDVPLRDSGINRANGGAYPWRIDGDFSTVASVTNVGDKPSRFIAEIYYPGGRYLFGHRDLAVGETASFDLRKIRDTRLPDANGDLLPLNVTSGQFRWHWYPGPNAPRMIGRAAMTSVTKGISASYSCMPNCGAHGPEYLIDGNTTISVSGYETMGTKERWYGASGGYNDFNTNMSGSTVDNTSIAGLGNITTGSLNVNGLASGETYWWRDYWYGYEYDDGFDCRYAQEQYTGSEPAQVVCVVPTNFRQTESSNSNGTLYFRYDWDSSTGTGVSHLARLSQCTIGEKVDYTASDLPFPSPPFPSGINPPNPTITEGSATGGYLVDNHSTPGTFVQPYQTRTITATQIYRYRCTCNNNNAWITLLGPINIVRSVSQNANGTWKHTITKSGESAAINPLP